MGYDGIKPPPQSQAWMGTLMHHGFAINGHLCDDIIYIWVSKIGYGLEFRDLFRKTL